MLRVAEQFSHSDTGRQRRGNEDAFLERAPLFVVADGMGGAQAGEVASRIAIELFADGLDIDEAADAGGAPRRSRRGGQRRDPRPGTRTTPSSRAWGPRSRRPTSARARSPLRTSATAAPTASTTTSSSGSPHDHSLVEELIRQGQLTEAEAEEHPQRSIITRALGPEPDVDVDMITLEGIDGDVYLLCSDGLTSMVPRARSSGSSIRAPRLTPPDAS
jgi:hypothetical protein